MPKPVKDMQTEYKLLRSLETKNGNKANMMEDCIKCQQAKCYSVCRPECPNIEAQR